LPCIRLKKKGEGKTLYRHLFEIADVIDGADAAGVTLHEIFEGLRGVEAKILLHFAGGTAADLIENVKVSFSLQLIDHTRFLEQD